MGQSQSASSAHPPRRADAASSAASFHDLSRRHRVWYSARLPDLFSKRDRTIVTIAIVGLSDQCAHKEACAGRAGLMGWNNGAAVTTEPPAVGCDRPSRGCPGRTVAPPDGRELYAAPAIICSSNVRSSRAIAHGAAFAETPFGGSC
jgi:hypothetical protein